MTDPAEWALPEWTATPDRLRDALADPAETSGEALLLDRRCATAVWLSLQLGRPLLVEGPPGVGKTQLARTLAATSGRHLEVLHCHEGLEVHDAVYEWDHARQLLHLEARRLELTGGATDASTTPSVDLVDQLHSEQFLVERPLLASLRPGRPSVLLIDEVDRSEESFEALLLEYLDRFEVTVPGLGTFASDVDPWVVLTSNDTRELTGAIRRRCFRVEFGYPDETTEREILQRRVPGLALALAERLPVALARLRTGGLSGPPGVSEGIDWASSLAALGMDSLDDDGTLDALPALLKIGADTETVRREPTRWFGDGPD